MANTDTSLPLSRDGAGDILDPSSDRTSLIRSPSISRPPSRAKIRDGIVFRWGNTWNPLLRRPRKPRADIEEQAPQSAKTRNNSGMVRAKFSLFMQLQRSKSRQSAKSSEAGDTADEEEEENAADIAYEMNRDSENPLRSQKYQVMRQYHIWNGVNLNKIDLPPLPIPPRQRTNLADVWENSDQAARQLGNLTRRGPHQNLLPKQWRPEYSMSHSNATLQREGTSIQQLIKDAARAGREFTRRPRTAPCTLYNPAETWTVKYMEEARYSQPMSRTMPRTRVSSYGNSNTNVTLMNLPNSPIVQNNISNMRNNRKDAEVQNEIIYSGNKTELCYR